MKRIINKLIYDTETSKELIHDYNVLHVDWHETLYQTKNNRYFILGEGGPMTRWSKSQGNAFTFGSGIKPVSEEEALEWITNNWDSYDVELLKKIFNEHLEKA